MAHPGLHLNRKSVKFTRDAFSAVTIRGVAPGRIQIGEKTYTRDVVLTAESVMENTIPVDFAVMSEADITAILEAEPEMLILGTGWSAMLPPRELLFAMARRGLGLESMNTPAACRTFNILVNEGRRPAAILKISA
jgi:uncharacterized protein